MCGDSSFLALTLLMLIHIVAGSGDVSLSPDKWPPEEFERLKNYTAQEFRLPKPLAISHGLGVVSSLSSSLATHAGLVALREGGNAMDACVATALTEIVLATGSFISFAGITEILYYKNDEKRIYSLDGLWNVPSHLDSSKILPVHTNEPNGASVLVPGFFAGVAEAVEKLATFKLETLLEPALYFAKNGFKVPSAMAKLIRSYFNNVTLLRTNEGKKLFTNPETGEYYKKGEIFKQPDLQKFLQTIASVGASAMYNGTWAEDMASLVQKENGFITLDDMKNYKVNWKNSVNTSYRDYFASSAGAYDGSSGGVELMETLNLMEVAGIGVGKESFLTNATELYWLASIRRFSDFISLYLRNVPNALDLLKKEFGLDFVLQNRLSKEFSRELWDQMIAPGGMDQINEKIKKLLGGVGVPQHRGAHSSAVVAMDKEGNVCSMIHTINSLPWGTGLFVQGIALPHSAAIQKSLVKQTKPGSRVASVLQPSIVFRIVEKDEKENLGDQNLSGSYMEKKKSKSSNSVVYGLEPAMALAVVGRSLQPVTSQLMTSLLDEQLNPVQALSRAQFMLPSPQSYYQDIRIQRYTVDENVLNEVRKKGQEIEETSYVTAKNWYGLGVVLTVDREGNRYAASTPYLDLDGIAEGEGRPTG